MGGTTRLTILESSQHEVPRLLTALLSEGFAYCEHRRRPMPRVMDTEILNPILWN
jgi:hypothetical protein